MGSRAMLTGADCFLRAVDGEVRRFNGASHLSQLILRLGPGFNLGAFRELVASVARATPIMCAPIGRRFGLGLPAYLLARAPFAPLPTIMVHDALSAIAPSSSGDAALPAIFEERLNARFALEHGELLRFDVVRYDGGAQCTDLAMTWAHLLLDGAGSELLIRYIDDCFRGRRPIGDLRYCGAPLASRPRTLVELAQRVRKWKMQINRFNAAPPRSLGGPRRRVAQAIAYDVVTLSRDETAIVTRRAAAHAGALTPVLFYLAAVMRAHDAVFTARGKDPGHYLVPVPVNLRPKGVEGTVFRSNISLIWFHVARKHVGEFAGLVEELKQQRRASIRDGLIESTSAVLSLLRVMPARLNAWLARSNLGGELASFYFAFTGEFLPGLDSFFGAEILNGFHAPSVMPSPGSSVVMSIRDGRLNVTFIYQRGAVGDDECLLLREQLLDDLLGRTHTADRLLSSA